MKKTDIAPPTWYPKNPVLMLRTCTADMESTHERANHFKWPESGYVAAPDWNTAKECGGGLHGLLWGKGSVSNLLIDDASAKWIIFLADADETVEIDSNKAKVKQALVLFCGSKDEAITFLYGHDIYQDKHHVGVLGTSTAGDGGTSTAGVLGTSTAGDGGTATAGDGGTATAGYGGTSTAGDRGTSTAGDGGTSTAGYRGTATAGYGGTATAGYGGTATAGYGGVIAIRYWNGRRYKYKVASIKDEDGDGDLRPNVKYRLNAAHEFEEVPA